jgi:hypothetical protein
MVLVVAVGLVVVVPAVAVAQPKGEVEESANQAAGAAADLGESLVNLFQAWAQGPYGWVLGAVILFLLLRFMWRVVRG